MHLALKNIQKLSQQLDNHLFIQIVVECILAQNYSYQFAKYVIDQRSDPAIRDWMIKQNIMLQTIGQKYGLNKYLVWEIREFY